MPDDSNHQKKNKSGAMFVLGIVLGTLLAGAALNPPPALAILALALLLAPPLLEALERHRS